MSKKFNNVAKGFGVGFKSVYYARVHCPVCKEKIFANALMCPNCKTYFTKTPYDKRIQWQDAAMKIIFAISAAIGISICLSDLQILLGILIGFVSYGLGYIVVQKIQSFKNFHYK